jgi:hypothetical protein
MKNFKHYLIAAVIAVVALPNLLSAQTMLTQTTLSSAISSTSTTTVVVASATGITATSTVIFVDQEAMFVNAVNAKTLSVTRGYNGTQAGTHLSSSAVFIGPPFAFAYQAPNGSCTRANVPYLPVIAFGISGVAPTVSDCLGSQWVTGTTANTVLPANYQLQLPKIGNVAYTSAGTSTSKATNTMYCTEIDLPYTKNLTGLGMLNGASTGTDKWVLALYDSGGNLLANSAVAGATASGNSTFQKQAFTAKYLAVGPAQYFACAQGDSGTSATINLLVTGTNDIYLTKLYASQTFGTLTSITAPTTFTTANGGYWILY